MDASPPDAVEHVVLLDEDRRVVGRRPKHLVHHGETPLHLGFSCYVFDGDGRLLVTRRAAVKQTFGGVWTNTLCGHPGPGEPEIDAVHRRARHELGMTLEHVETALPDFRYRAEQDGIVENEWCPVFLAVGRDAPLANPHEVDDHRWIRWAEFLDRSRAEPATWSPWCREQADALVRSGVVTEYCRRVLAA